jgi:hypothetical protein
MRRDTFLEKVAVELTWLGALWTLWLATAASSARTSNDFHVRGCDKPRCDEILSVEAFAFLAWLTCESLDSACQEKWC